MSPYLLALIAALLACILAYLGHQAVLARASATWPTFEGHVVESSVQDVGASDTGPVYAVQVTYRYARDGVEYESSRFQFGSTFLQSRFLFRSPARAAVASDRFRPGAMLGVRVHPTRHALCTLFPRSGWDLYATIVVLFGVLMYFLALLIQAL